MKENKINKLPNFLHFHTSDFCVYGHYQLFDKHVFPSGGGLPEVIVPQQIP